MIFTILGIFFRIFKTVFLILFSIFNNKKINKKTKKRARGPRGCDVAAPRGPAQRAYVARIYIIYYYTYIYKRGHTLINRRVI